MIRVLLADDEPVARERLALAVAGIPEVELAGMVRNGREALDAIRRLRPDVAVLDILMPGLDGFAVVEALEEDDHVPEVIFVTAFHEHAMRAFEVHAVDYLLKPVDFARFREAIEQARERMVARSAQARLAELQKLVASLQGAGGPDDGYLRETWVRSARGLVRVRLEDVDLVTAEGDYVALHVGSRSHLVKDTMAALEARLDPALFLRVHRSAIINLHRVEAIHRRSARALSLVLDGGHQVPVGPSYMAATLQALQARPQG